MILYVIAATLFFYLILPFYFFERLIKQKSVDWKKKFGFCKKVEGDVILLYACSVGEVMVLSHIIPRLRQEFPNYKIVVATATTTGQEVAQKEFSAKCTNYGTKPCEKFVHFAHKKSGESPGVGFSGAPRTSPRRRIIP